MFFASTVFAPLVFGQMDSNSITVTASRSVSLTPDEALFSVVVGSGATAGLDDILGALEGSGITMANFSGVNTSAVQCVFTGTPSTLPTSPAMLPTVDWAFSLPVPLAKIGSAIKTLTAFQQTIGQNKSGFTLSFSIVGTRVSPQLQMTQTCVLADIIADAQTQAQKVASAAGLGVGSILALSSPVITSVSSGTTVPVPTIVSQLTSPPVCTVTVKFGLTRF